MNRSRGQMAGGWWWRLMVMCWGVLWMCGDIPLRAADIDAATEAQYRTAMEQGATYARQGKIPTALAKFKRACELKPMSGEPLYRLALTYCDEHMYSAAESTARKATILEPRHAGSWLVLGTALFYLDREAEAIVALEKAFSIDRNNPHAPYLLGRCYYFGGNDRARAVAYFKRTLELDPKYTAATFMLGCCYLDEDIPAAAAKLFEMVVASEPGNLEAHFRLALCRIKEKDFDTAEKILLDVIRQNEKDYRAHLRLGDLYMNFRGENAYAIVHYERFLEHAPAESPERERVSKVLKEIRHSETVPPAP